MRSQTGYFSGAKYQLGHTLSNWRLSPMEPEVYGENLYGPGVMTKKIVGTALSKKDLPLVGGIIVACPTVDSKAILTEEFENFVSSLSPYTKKIYVCVHETLRYEKGILEEFCKRNDASLMKIAGEIDRLNFYSRAIEKISKINLTIENDLIFTNFTLIGPLRPLDKCLTARELSGVDLVSAFTFHTNVDQQFRQFSDSTKMIAETSWLQLSPKLFNDPQFTATLKEAARIASRESVFAAEAHFTIALQSLGYKISGYDRHCNTESSSPLWLEAERLVSDGHPFIHQDVLTLDPLFYEMQAINGRDLVRAVEDSTNFDVNLLWKAILRSSTLRDIATRFDELNVIDEKFVHGRMTKSKMKLALVAHVYYSDFIYEVIDHFLCLPRGSTLLVSVSSQENKELIEQVLNEKKVQKFVVRVVEQNRGRDMSALFITFREEFLSNDYDLALRLHSKKSPQVAPHISASFRTHLIDNLILNKNYVSGVVELFENNPLIGMAIPPTIHIAFGTLGHGWFTNLDGTKRVAKRLGTDVKLDEHTPLAAYGTMFWFRPKALAQMFEENWRWEEFNAEPNHIDGGLAHIMERLMGYVAQSQGFRVTQIASTRQLVANYVKLEYKLQRLASTFPSADIREQIRLADTMFGTGKSFLARTNTRIWYRWIGVRTKIKRNYPRVWTTIRPGLKMGRTVIDFPKQQIRQLRKHRTKK